MGELLEEVCAALAPQLAAQDIRTSIEAPPAMRLWADRDLLRRALLNLVLNALDAMPDGGELQLTACRGRRGPSWKWPTPDRASTIRRKRIFEPFFTTKSEGTGLGLAIVYRVAEAHDGDVRAVQLPRGRCGVHPAHSASGAWRRRHDSHHGFSDLRPDPDRGRPRAGPAVDGGHSFLRGPSGDLLCQCRRGSEASGPLRTTSSSRT